MSSVTELSVMGNGGRMIEQILNLRAKGLTYSQIAARLSITRNSVSGYIHRDKIRKGLIPPPAPRGPRKRNYIPRVRAPHPIGATDPRVRKLFEALSAQRKSLSFLSLKAGVSIESLSQWRRGRRRPTEFLLQCAETVVYGEEK